MYPQVGAALMAASRRVIGLVGTGAAPRPPRPPRPAAPVAGAAGAAGCAAGVESAATSGARSASAGQRKSVISSDDPFPDPSANTARRFNADASPGAASAAAYIAIKIATNIPTCFAPTRVDFIGWCL